MPQDGPCHVLLVDDTPEIRLILRTLFRIDAELVVIGEAKNGLEAVRMAEEHRPDVVVLDLAMPIMDGLEAIPEIARVSPETSIVMYTANASRDTERTALELGAHHFVQKGGSPTEIVEAVQGECAAG